MINQNSASIQNIIGLVELGQKLTADQQQELGMTKIVEHYLDHRFKGRGYVSTEEAKEILNIKKFESYSDDNTNVLIRMLESYMPDEEGSATDYAHTYDHRFEMDL